MNRPYNPASIAPPYKDRYSHAMDVEAGSRMLFTAGTVGVKPDGEVPADFAAQVDTVMQSLTQILVAFVPALVDPRWMVEVEIVAASKLPPPG
jgi:enamine deaminase RidA (YjgF/YER057c/UK114 family)